MKNQIVISVLFATLVALPVAVSAGKPNILLIYSDDHGWADLGIQGVDKDVQTPHLDQFARDGVLFKRGYVTAPQCTPSRAGVMTGIYQNRFGVEHNGIAMKSEVVTLPEQLKAAGYLTGMSGKWHLNVEDQRQRSAKQNIIQRELGPWAQGFDEYFEGFRQDYNASHALDGTPLANPPKAVRDPRCRVVIQTEAALAFLKRREAQPGQPWFCYLAYMAPHVPLESPEPWFSKTPEHLPLQRRQALALLAAIDDGIGRIRAKIREMGQEQNTLIFFIGDNGAPLGSAWDGSINLPMRGQKGMLSEGGIRVPFLAAWPGKIPGGQVFDHPVHSLDVAATAVALTGQARGAKLDGVNLLPHLTGEVQTAPHETLYWRWMAQAAILEFPHKLIVLGGQQRLLFDVSTPEGEAIERNLLEQKPEIAARLDAKLKLWSSQLDPPGLPGPLSDRHVGLFAEHGISAASAAAVNGRAKADPQGSIQGWIARNGTLAVKDGALILAPAADLPKNARPFFTHSGLDLVGPVTATLRIRSKTGGKSSITWRTRTASFTPEQTASFDWPATRDWQELKVELSENGRLIHLRINPPKDAAGLEIQSIDLRDSKGKATAFHFGQAR